MKGENRAAKNHTCYSCGQPSARSIQWTTGELAICCGLCGYNMPEVVIKARCDAPVRQPEPNEETGLSRD